ncbi:MAG TPA: hypothetical protein VID95_08875 [Candidatus Limnocylindrales bacterium]
MRLRGVVVVVAAGLLWLACALATLAASPSPEPAVGDPRSSGQGPGLVGDPGFALLAVVAIGAGTVAATLVYVRLTARKDV